MKNPILVGGILMMGLFLYQTGNKFHWWEQRRKKLMPSSCRAVLVKLKKRIPENWRADCEGRTYNNLFVEIKFPEEARALDKERKLPQLKTKLYREMANNLILLAKNSPEENLEKTFVVRIRLLHPRMRIDALSEGRYIVKLQTLTDRQLIAQHLKTTVQVKESFPQ